LAVVLIERVPSIAARCSAPTWSTPGRPCRNARSAASERATSPSSGVTAVIPASLRRAVAGGRRAGDAAVGGPAAGASAGAAAGRGTRPPTGPDTLSAVDVLVVDHPLAKSRLTALRDSRTEPGAFRAALHELSTMLVYEAT